MQHRYKVYKDNTLLTSRYKILKQHGFIYNHHKHYR